MTPRRPTSPTEPGPFCGFGPDVVDFWAGLEVDNSKAYWERHAAVFQTQVKAPMAALLASIEPVTGPFKIFRPNRDVRFSADKSPYKTAHGAVRRTDGGSDLYLQISASGLLVAAGMYAMEKDQVQRFRAAVADSRTGPTLVRAVHAAEGAGLAVDPGMAPPLKTAPRGYPAEHPRIDWLRWKGCVAATEIDPEVAGGPEVRSSVLAAWQCSAGLIRWLERHVGPAEVEPR